MESGESEADHKQKDDLWQECDKVKTDVIIFHSQVQQIKIHTEIVSDVFPGDVIEICVFKKLIPVKMIKY